MVEQKYLFDYAHNLQDYINSYLKDGWTLNPHSIRLITSGTLIYSCALLYREKKD